MKTPIAALHEFCMKRKILPQYNISELNSEKIYECELSFDEELENIVVKGNGRSKKEAKHSAANEALKLIILLIESDNYSDDDFIDMSLIKSPYDDKIQQNYMRELRQVCTANLLPSPEYTSLAIRENCNHYRQSWDTSSAVNPGTFKQPYVCIQCNVASLTEIGKSCNKRDARQISAQLMIEKIKNTLKNEYIVPEPENFKNGEHDSTKNEKSDEKVNIDIGCKNIYDDIKGSDKNEKNIVTYYGNTDEGMKKNSYYHCHDTIGKQNIDVKLKIDDDNGIKITEEFNDDNDKKEEENTNYKNSEELQTVINKFRNLNKEQRSNFKINISDYHNVTLIEEFFPVCYAINSKLKDINENEILNLENPEMLLKDICCLSESEYDFINFKKIYCKLNRYIFVGLTLKTSPPWVTVGKGNTEPEARKDAVKKMLHFLKHIIM